MLDLIVIHPGAAHGIYGSDLANSLIAVEPPLWTRLIAGYVRDAGFNVQIIDAEADGLSPEEVATLAINAKPRLVCMAVYGHQPSASTQQMDGALKTVEAIHEMSGGHQAQIMVGGHVAALPEQTLKESKANFACNGEGPETVLQLLQGEDLLTIPGLVCQDKFGTIINNDSAELINIDRLHGNVWDLLPMYRYRAHNWQCFDDLNTRQPYASIYTSLGCPYRCSFCCINAPFQSNRYRMRKPADVVEEMVSLHVAYGVSTFKIVDEMFILNETHYTSIARAIIDAFTPSELQTLNIWAYARVDTIREGHLQLLRNAGFKWLALGIESGSKYVRDGAQKRLKNDDIEQVVKGIQSHGINVIGNFIFGLPDDTLDSMRETLDLSLRLNCEFANFYSAMAYPGSPLYVEALAKGWTLPSSWRGYSQHNSDSRPLDTRHIGAAEVLKFRDEAFQIYFRNPKYLAMVKKKFGDAAVKHVKDMVSVKLRRKLIEDTFAPVEACSGQ